MKPDPVQTSLVLGVRTSVGHGIISKGNHRSTENEVVAREGKPPAKTINSDLCEQHKLPDGIECASRKLEDNGFYYCPRGKKGCPLRG